MILPKSYPRIYILSEKLAPKMIHLVLAYIQSTRMLRGIRNGVSKYFPSAFLFRTLSDDEAFFLGKNLDSKYVHNLTIYCTL